MEHSRRKEESPVWLNSSIHVWKTKNDINVVNLRDASEHLPALPSARAEERPPGNGGHRTSMERTGENNERTTEPTKQETLNEILALMHRASDQTRGSSKGTTADSNLSTNAGGKGPVTDSEGKASLFPEPKTSGIVDVEFVQGVNLPGGKNVSPPLHTQPPRDSMQTVALFHDPVWGAAAVSSGADVFDSGSESQASAVTSLQVENVSGRYSKGDVNPPLMPAPAAPVTMIAPSAPLSYKVPGNVNETMFTPQAQPVAMTSSPSQLGYPQNIGLSTAGWAGAAPHPTGVAMRPVQFVSVPVPVMPHNAVMAVPQPYRMPYSVYQMQPQAPHPAQLQHQPVVYHTSPGQELHHIHQQKVLAPQDATPRPGTNIGATPFVPGGKSV
ncbi:hypothetical protein, conserved [Trypanosoma brucei gambiense DAL972]|uniref:Uncharacterized protein n=1 Tax=Trypanosoma brucei gambiense (strain MHOM/CI/86/DAL972) TaxID=679716 RepID=C9ZRH3_TRYB9|nr:hypothetical protein, conserved [Trypanosoma brucei gambiense DAL972]CBH12003.1 hypothetical protein, conserved [Trypanosoma brucei gambiense DAL972]|eukprot:XP_011774288.1 hypothetical protein, conserved [Trypanosoma brucei gambiense DAL972]